MVKENKIFPIVQCSYRRGLIHIQAEDMENLFHQYKRHGTYCITRFIIAQMVLM